MTLPPILATLTLAFALAASAQDSVLVFNEIQYHPANEAAQTEWIELRSLQGVDVDIGGWRITGAVDFTFPNGRVMPGGGHLVVAAIPGQIAGALGPWTGQLANSGETIQLVNRSGRVMDELTYSDGGDWPVGADGSGATLARRSGSAASGAKQWTVSTTAGGSPGAKNFAEPGDPPTVTTLIPLAAAWKYRDDNLAPPAAWTGTGFDDSAWLSGDALLYAGSPNVTGAGEGLHGYWPLEQTSGTTAANGAAGGTVGTLFTGATWVTDASRGRVLNFDGADGYVSAGTLPQMTMSNNFTWSFWANSTQTGGNVILGNRFSPSGTDWSPREFIKFTSDQLQYDHNLVEVINYADFPTGSWNHHALVKQGATMTYYRNGIAGGTLTIGAGQNNGQPLYFGGDKANENWSGRLDDIAVWTKALPASSITALANGSATPLTAPTGSAGVPLTTSLTQGPSTHYFRRSFNFTGAKERTTLTLQHLLDDGAVFYLNGAEVLRTNLPAGVVTHGTAATAAVTGSALSASTAIPVDALVNGMNVLAVEVHQHTANPDMVFGATLVASETPALLSGASLLFSEISGAAASDFFIELKNNSTTAVSTAGWILKTSAGGAFTLPTQSIAPGGFASINAAALGFTPADGLRLSLFAPGGSEFRDSREVTNRLRGLTADGGWGYPTSATPGGANIAVVSSAIVINEIFYKGLNNSPEQWIELHNRSAAPVDVSGWEFSDGISFVFPVGAAPIPAGGFRVVAWDTAAFATLHPGAAATGPWSGSLSGKGETITLRDGNGNVADQVAYADGGRWSQWADGGGSSLELRDPDADNSKGEAWDASDESGQAPWVTVTATDYHGLAVNSNGPDPAGYNEFVFGLLNTGEFLIDDIMVRDVTAGTNLIQNGSFDSGNAATWRIIGTHQGTVVSEGGGNVLKVSASGATEHMHNHAETTLKNGVSYPAIDPQHDYSITFRAKWLRGSNRLHTRLWHNRLPRQTLLPTPATGGTPGAANRSAVVNIGPTFDRLSHAPVVPAVSEAATVSVAVADDDGLGAVELWTSVNGAAWTSTAMSPAGSGIYAAPIFGKPAGTLVQFYVRATDTAGAVTFFPAAGPASRAMIPWQDGRAQLTLASGAQPRNVRIVLPTADATELYKAENLMSDAARPCTVILDEREVYYRAGVRLKSSEHGRFNPNRCGYTLEFANDELFLGTHDTVAIDRSGGGGAGQKEILIRRLTNTAGGIYAPEDDIIRVITPVGATLSGSAFTFTGTTMTGAAILSKTRLDREFLDAQWEDGGEGAMQKYERIYVLTETVNPATRNKDAGIVPENPKVPQDSTAPPGVPVTSLGTNKESYRWYWLMQNARDADNYSGIMNVTNAIGQTNLTQFNSLANQHIDVNAWLRACVPSALFGVSDNYLGTGGGQHNALIYFPPGKKAVLMPWDLDTVNQSAGNTTASLTAGGDLSKFLDPANPSALPQNRAWRRLYYGHIRDILSRSFNTSYMTTWAAHYSRFGTDDLTSSVGTYLTPRAAHAANVINGTNGQTAPIPFVTFTRTSPSPMSVGTPFAPVSGDGWIDVAEIRLQGSAEPLAVTWTDDNSWTLSLPISAGTNTYTLLAFDNAGTQVGSTTVTVTGTGGIFPASAGNLIVSELHYNPPGNTDATEFLELLNATGATLDLGGCHFDEENAQGIAYTFPAGVQLAPGARIVVARSRAGYIAAYGSANLAPNQYEPSDLDNGGESLVLYAASGLEVFRFSYNDNVASTDGDGRSLVRVLSSTAPDGSTYVWRASTVAGGNPGVTDATAFTGNGLADGDQDGVAALLEYTMGTSDAAGNAPPWTLMQDSLGRWLLTFPRALNNDDATLTIQAVASLGEAWLPAAATLLASTPSGNVATETWHVTPPAGAATFFVRLKATLR